VHLTAALEHKPGALQFQPYVHILTASTIYCDLDHNLSILCPVIVSNSSSQLFHNLNHRLTICLLIGPCARIACPILSDQLDTDTLCIDPTSTALNLEHDPGPFNWKLSR
jgi:hypothetical protein